MVDEARPLDLNIDENLILQNMEAWWDEIDSRLIICSMVNDSIMKGMVSAISEEAMQHISSKDEEINELKTRLNVYESSKITERKSEVMLVPKTLSESSFNLHNRAQIHLQTLKTGLESVRRLNCHKEMLHTFDKMDEVIDDLSELLPSFCDDARVNTSFHEEQFQWEFERDATLIVLQAFEKDLCQRQEASLLHQISISDLQNEHRLENIVGLLASIQELESILKSICTAEPDCLMADTKDGILDMSSSPSALQLNEDHLVNYYRSEVNRIKRQLETSVHRKTEDLFRLKREVIRDIGSFRWKRGDDFKALRGNFPDIIHKLEKIHMDDKAKLEAKNIEKLNKNVLLLKKLLEAAFGSFGEVESRIDEQKGRLDKVLDEFKFLSIKVYGEGAQMSLKARLQEAANQIQGRDESLLELNHRLVSLSNDLEAAKKENEDLCLVVQRRESEIISAAEKAEGQRKQMESVITYVHAISKAFEQFQIQSWDRMQTNNFRLQFLHHEIDELSRKFDALKKEESWYRKNFEITFSDLQKAEAEVDVLGDEVDTLLSILEKIYRALDYYSPVLLHYPGVVETLKLARRKLKGAQ